jgi:hypothetical protein
VIQKLLSMIGREGEDAVIPALRPAQRLGQTRHLRINPANARIIKPHDFITMMRNAAQSEVGPVPPGIQVPRTISGDRALSHER